MVQFNFYQREVNCKIVYYGCGLSGKTTNLEVIHQKTPKEYCGDLTQIETMQDRTLFFDYMPVDIGTVSGMQTKLRLFTVPGQVMYNTTRKIVLQEVDGIVFVVDSQKRKLEDNIESFINLQENLLDEGIELKNLPLVIQWNKRDLPDVLPVEELDEKINTLKAPSFEAVATQGQGVVNTLKGCAGMVLKFVTKKAEEAKSSYVSQRPEID